MPRQSSPYEEIFYRRSDTIVFEAQTVELIDRCYRDAQVRISPVKARIAEDEFNPEDLVHLKPPRGRSPSRARPWDSVM
jgi:hypothetical protein